MPSENARAAGHRSVKLFIGGLTRTTTTKLLREHFSQYGQVLDCVAMVQPDGRPRGFGYVTLDSTAAAERCLTEPQVIDGRVVDMKRAVPGNSAGKGSGQRSPTSADQGKSPSQAAGAPPPFFPPGSWDLQCPSAAQLFAAQMAMATQASVAWAAAQAATSPTGDMRLDYFGMLHKDSTPSTTASACDFSNDMSSLSLGSMDWQGFGTSPSGTPTAFSNSHENGICLGTSSLGAPEFTPSQPTDDGITPQKIGMPAEEETRRRSVLGDITNLSPVKVALPSSTLGNRADTSALLGGFRSRQPPTLDIQESIYDDFGENEPSSAVDTPLGISLPPGLSPPRSRRSAAAAALPAAAAAMPAGIAALRPR